MSAKPKRHRWGERQDFPLGHKSERECLDGCGIVKVSRHEGREHWEEFWRGLDKIVVGKTPACESGKSES